MSRSKYAEVRATSLQVKMECDQCDKVEWVDVPMPIYDGDGMEYAVVQASDSWEYADDALVCSEKCSMDFWEWPSVVDGAEF